MKPEKEIKKLRKLVIGLYDAIVDTHHGGYQGIICNHEKWDYMMKHHGKLLGTLQAAAIHSKVERDKGVCSSCGGKAADCYPRHSQGRSCA